MSLCQQLFNNLNHTETSTSEPQIELRWTHQRSQHPAIISKMVLWRDRMTYAHEVNSYVNSRRPQPANSAFHVRESPLTRRKYPIHPEWKAALDQYHEELDRLREDWALEIFGRHYHVLANFRHVGPHTEYSFALQTKPWYIPEPIFRKAFDIALFSSRHLEFTIKEAIWPLSWKPLLQHYTRRLQEIERKYSGLGLCKTPWEARKTLE